MRHPVVRWILAHILACYAWMGIVALFNAVRPYDNPNRALIEDEPPAWYERKATVIAGAPLVVPVLLVSALTFTVASPVERFPAMLFLIMLVMYVALLLVSARILVRRSRPVDAAGSADTLGGKT